MLVMQLRWEIITPFYSGLAKRVQYFLLRSENAYRQARCSAGIAQESRLSATLSLGPVQWWEGCQLLALLNELAHGLEGNLRVASQCCGHFEDIDVFVWDARSFGRLESIVQEWDTGLL